MAYNELIQVDAAADLSAAQYHAILVGGTIAANNSALGILQNKPESGEDAALGFFGRLRYRAGGAVAAGAGVTVTTSGWFVSVGSNQIAVGTALAAVSSGGIGEGLFNFIGSRSTIALTSVASNTVGFA